MTYVQRAVKHALSVFFLCIVSVSCYEVWAHDLFFEAHFSFTEIKSTLRWAETVRNSLYGLWECDPDAMPASRVPVNGANCLECEPW